MLSHNSMVAYSNEYKSRIVPSSYERVSKINSNNSKLVKIMRIRVFFVWGFDVDGVMVNLIEFWLFYALI
jgi:hypothetical protein